MVNVLSFLEKPTDRKAYIAPHIVGIVARAIGVFLIFFIKKVVGREEHSQFVLSTQRPFDASFETEEVVGWRRKVDEIAGRVEACLLQNQSMFQLQPSVCLTYPNVFPRQVVVEARRRNIRQIVACPLFVGPDQTRQQMILEVLYRLEPYIEVDSAEESVGLLILKQRIRT